MAIEFKLPELGENIESADITKVLVKVGDKVEVDQVVLEIETDKATVEVPSEVAGTVTAVHVKDGDTAKIGDVVFELDSASTTSEEPVAAPVVEEKIVEATPEPTPLVKEENLAHAVSGLVEFKLPELGENIESADITKVVVKKGDTINVDDVLLEIETDKATVEVPSDVAGIIKEVKVSDGSNAKVGEVVFIIEATSSQPAKIASAPSVDKTVEAKKVDAPKSAPVEVKEAKSVKSPITPEKRKRDLPAKIAPASPTVRRFAREIGIDIHNVSGTGPGGRISIDDIKKYAKAINEKISKGEGMVGGMGIAHEPLPDFTKWGEVTVEPMNNVRKKTAHHLSYAWATVPHVTQFDKADITELEKVRKQYSKVAEAAGGKLTVTAILLKIIASALKIYPKFNSSIDMQNSQVIMKDYFNIGIAVDTERGLIVPVVKNVDQKNIIDLAVELSEISAKARDKKTSIDDMQGGNFTISNLGGIGGTGFSPIVNTPEVAILGVSRASYEQVYIDGNFETRLMMPLSLSYDHRIIDGADGARFLRWVCQALENPFLLSLQG